MEPSSDAGIGPASQNLDRLLPRHQVRPRRVTLEWDVRPPRKLLRKPERFSQAEVVDLSLDGALVEADLDAAHEIDDVIVVRLGGATGRALIKHKRLSDAGTGWLYGVQWLTSPQLKTAVDDAVAQLRSSDLHARRAWEQGRR